MTALESIGNARTRIAQARELLLRPTPASLESCREILFDVAQILREMITDSMTGQLSESSGPLTPEVIEIAREIKQTVKELEARIAHGSRYCMGWMQMRMGIGYSDRGVPILVETEGRSFEL